MQRRRVTLSDVARKVGVHPSTVSRVLNPQTRSMVNQETVSAVDRAAHELGYTRHPFATALRTGRSDTIGILIPDLMNPVFPPIIRGIEEEIEKAGYTAFVSNTENSVQKERLALNNLLARHVDGLISATAQRSEPLVENYASLGRPVVLINRRVEGQNISSVTPDDRSAVFALVEHLHGLGHRRIAYLAGPDEMSTGHVRALAFQDAIAEAGIIQPARLLVRCAAFTEEEGYRALLRLLDGGEAFTAVMAGNDLMALGCYRALAERGLRCPGDVSVTGFNDMPFADRFAPPMTTIRVPLFRMGQFAARTLLDELATPGLANQTVVLKCELIVRGSTGPASAKV